MQGVLNNFVIATLPCWLIGLWSTGERINSTLRSLSESQLPGWRGDLLAALGTGPETAGVLSSFSLGLLHFLPIFLAAVLASVFWDGIFATLRRRPPDEGLLASSWLFALLLPAGTDLYHVALGMSFGLVFGKYVYGGSGRYLVNPALLAIAFLWLAYPESVFAAPAWVPLGGLEQTPALQPVAADAVLGHPSFGPLWWELFIGLHPGPLAANSILGSLLGALYLVASRCASWRVLLGALTGVLLTAGILNGLTASDNPLFALPWSWHLLFGGLVFAVVFLATDPVAGAMTDSGRWAFGMLTGCLAVLLQVSTAAMPLAALFAVFLASLTAPLLDFLVIEHYLWRRRRALVESEDNE